MNWIIQIIVTIFILNDDCFAKQMVNCPKGTQYKEVEADYSWNTKHYGCDRESKDGSYVYHGPFIAIATIKGKHPFVVESGIYNYGKRSGKWTLGKNLSHQAAKGLIKKGHKKIKLGFINYKDGKKHGKAEYTKYEKEMLTGDIQITHHQENYLFSRSRSENKNGIFKTFHGNNSKGQTFEIAEYKDSDLVGSYMKYYKNGQIMEKGQYDSGAKVGQWTYFYENGRKEKQGHYKKIKSRFSDGYTGQETGLWKQWEASGKMRKFNAKNGRREWVWD